MGTMTSVIIPPPVGGMLAQSNLIITEDQYALELINWVPDIASIVSRRGYEYFEVINEATSGPFKSLIPYSNGSEKILFAANADGLFKVPISAGATISKLTSGGVAEKWSGAIMSSGDKVYMRLTDGSNKNLIYDGTTISDAQHTPSGGVTWIYTHQGRFFFGVPNRLDFYYLDANVIDPDSSSTEDEPFHKFMLGQFMNKGGRLIGMASWSMDTGSGMHDFAVFVSDRGQSCVYQGSDPSSSATWSLIGLFDHGEPVSDRCFLRVGAELFIWTMDGLISMKTMISKTTEILGLSGITSKVAIPLTEDVKKGKNSFGFEACLYSNGQLIMCNVPLGEKSTQYVFNTLTGAASIFKGINIHCLAEVDNKLFAGACERTDRKSTTSPPPSGSPTHAYGIYQLDTGRTDNGNPIELDVKHAFTFLGDSTRTKKITHAEIHLEASQYPDLQFEVLTDLDLKGGKLIGSAPTAKSLSLWSAGCRWDSCTWAGSHKVYNLYRGIRKICRTASIRIKTAAKDLPMSLHGTTVYFSYTDKTTPRERENL